MKKIKIYRQIKVGKNRYKDLVECEKIINDNLAIYTTKSPRKAVIIDIRTGLSVAYAHTKVEAMKRFKELEEGYNTIVNNKIYYNKIIEDFNKLEEYHPEVNLDIAESESEYED